MRKYAIIIVVLTLAFFTTGCQDGEQLSIQGETSNFAFNLPEGYSISDIGDTCCSIYRDAEMVGGIVATDLNKGSIVDIDKTELRQYLDTFAPLPLTYEYISMYFSNGEYDYISINFTVSDTKTMQTKNYHHYLFERDAHCYDLWLDDELVDEDIQAEFLTTVVEGGRG